VVTTGITTSVSEPRTEESTAELIRRAADDITTLVREELALARAEVSEKAGRAGRGVGLFGGAGLVSLYGILGVLTGIVLLLAKVMPAWSAALLVGVVLLIVAGVLALAGRAQVRQATPPVPQEAVRGVRADVDTVTTAVEERGHRG
jgi:hypothetical protein